MALPVLDGNQTATTLSSVVTGGEHIVAHSVVSLGTTAISNISNSVSAVINSVGTDNTLDTTTNFIKIGGHQSGSNQTAHIVHVSNGGAMSVDATGSVVSISNFPATQTIAGTVTANVSIGSATTNPLYSFIVDPNNDQIFAGDYPFPISGTVTANLVGWSGDNFENLRIGGFSVGAGDATRLALEVVGVDGNPVSVSGAVTANTNFEFENGGLIYSRANIFIGDPGLEEPTPINNANPLPISGTVTANNPSGALTTRFGSVTTANTAQITSAVTNTSRKYLLAQNISAGTVTIGIGFSPTTTQGIQLPAGGGLTFDAFCPTGAVYWLGAVTGAAWTILEG